MLFKNLGSRCSQNVKAGPQRSYKRHDTLFGKLKATLTRQQKQKQVMKFWGHRYRRAEAGT